VLLEMLRTAAIGAAGQSGPVQDVSITFARHIAPIISTHCASCHRSGEMGPFPLLTYSDVKKRAQQIAEVTRSRYMPPWLPAQARGVFVGERGLSRTEIELIQGWVAHGAPEGDAAELPPPPRSAGGAHDWPLGPPDVVLTLAEPYTVPAEGADLVRSFVLPVNLPDDSYLQAIDVRPGNPRLVHHAAFAIDTTGGARMLDQGDPQPGYPGMGDIGFNTAGMSGIWSPAPHAFMRRLPAGVGRAIPKSCDLVMEMHFNALGKPESIQPLVGLYLAKGAVSKPVTTFTLGTYYIDIAPGEKGYAVQDELTLPVDVDLFSIAPHAHYVCRRMDVTCELGDGTVLPLLRIVDWDFNFQQEYQYLKPIRLPAGAKVRMQFLYDNSPDNPRNPHSPPRRVRAGAKPSDEMGILFLHMTADDDASRQQLEQLHQQKRLKRFEEARAKRGGG
jgi:hypothetical protein